MEQFVNGVREFAAFIVNLKLLFEIWILKENRGFRSRIPVTTGRLELQSPCM